MVARGFLGLMGSPSSHKLSAWDALTTINHLKTFESVYHCEEEDDTVVEFVACGKNEELDSDMNYALDTDLGF